ncbi:MAG: 50S ribosomal protein L6 [Candidatus Moraniibacteriota bacterium]
MSRIGKKPFQIPDNCEASLHANVLTVKGPKGTLSLTHTLDVVMTITDGQILVEKKGSSLQALAMWGTAAKLVKNLFEGVTTGFSRALELNGVGFRMTIAGKKLNLALGFSHPVVMEVPEGIEVKIENNVLTISGLDKQKVGQFAAVVKKLKPVEPYKGKGFRYVGEQVRRKEGKKASA